MKTQHVKRREMVKVVLEGQRKTVDWKCLQKGNTSYVCETISIIHSISSPKKKIVRMKPLPESQFLKSIKTRNKIIEGIDEKEIKSVVKQSLNPIQYIKLKYENEETNRVSEKRGRPHEVYVKNERIQKLT